MARLARIFAVLAAFAAMPACPAVAAGLAKAPDAPGYTVAGGSATVHAIARLGDTIYIGGSFTSVNGQARSNLAAISAADGSLTSWAPNANQEVDAITTSGSTIYLGGQFDSVASTGTVLGPTRTYLAAVDTSGALLPWDPVADGNISALAVHGSDVYVGGSFTSLGDVNGSFHVVESNLGRVDGVSGRADSNWKPNPDSTGVDALALQPDGSYLYAGGYFSNVGTTPRAGLAAFSLSDGSLDPSWNPSDPGNGGSINAMAMAPDGSQLYVTGDFFVNSGPCCSMGGAARYKAAGLAPAGNGSHGDATPFAPEPDSEGHAIAATPSSVYIGGSYNTFYMWNGGSVARSLLGALDPVSGQPQAWDPAPTPDGSGVYALLAAPDGSLYVGGAFTSMAQTPAAAGFASFTLPPAATSPPSVSGTPQPGQTLSCVNGTWSGGMPQTYSFQLLRDGSAVGAPSSSATSYTAADEDLDHTLACRITATNRAGSASAESAPVTVVAVPSGPGPEVVAEAAAAPSAPPSLAPPLLFRSVNVVPVKGRVLVKVPGSKSFIRIQDARNVPVETIVDATNGVVQLVSARDAGGHVQTGTFYGGLFKIVQLKGNPPITELILIGGDFSVCAATRARHALASAGAKAGRSVRHLWADATGSFRTKGRYAAATVRGTKWLTDDRCKGTLIRVVSGAVSVRDLVRRKTVPLRGAHQYIALARRGRG